MKNPERIRDLVFRGVRQQAACISAFNLCSFLVPAYLCLLQGIAQPLRKELWKFLLGFYPWNSTPKEREDILRSKTSVPTSSSAAFMGLFMSIQRKLIKKKFR